MSQDIAHLNSDATRHPDVASKEDIELWRKEGWHKYKGYTFMAMQPRENLEALQTFEVRDDDVYCVTYPKSGTHWIWEIVQLIMVQGDAQKINRNAMKIYLEITIAASPNKVRQSTPGYKEYEKLPSPRLIATHIPEPLCPPQWFTKNAKIIYFARNPKDRLVSAYNFGILASDPKLRSWDTFFQFFFRDNVPYGSWFDHVLRYWQHRDRDNFLFVKYEDCHKDLKGTISKIAEFLGKDLSDGVIESITQQCTMKGMKKAYNKVEEDYPETGKMVTHLFGQVPFLRKGAVGNWKEYFTPKQNESFDKHYAEKMAGSGLTFDFEL